MSEEIKQKAMENWKNKYPLNTLKGESRKEFEEFIDTTLSQALQKQGLELLERIRFDMKGRNSLIVEIEDILKDINSNN